MNLRNGFVSNSSSSSFIILVDKIPTKKSDIRKMFNLPFEKDEDEIKPTESYLTPVKQKDIVNYLTNLLCKKEPPTEEDLTYELSCTDEVETLCSQDPEYKILEESLLIYDEMSDKYFREFNKVHPVNSCHEDDHSKLNSDNIFKLRAERMHPIHEVSRLAYDRMNDMRTIKAKETLTKLQLTAALKDKTILLVEVHDGNNVDNFMECSFDFGPDTIKKSNH